MIPGLACILFNIFVLPRGRPGRLPSIFWGSEGKVVWSSGESRSRSRDVHVLDSIIWFPGTSRIIIVLGGIRRRSLSRPTATDCWPWYPILFPDLIRFVLPWKIPRRLFFCNWDVGRRRHVVVGRIEIATEGCPSCWFDRWINRCFAQCSDNHEILCWTAICYTPNVNSWVRVWSINLTMRLESAIIRVSIFVWPAFALVLKWMNA